MKERIWKTIKIFFGVLAFILILTLLAPSPIRDEHMEKRPTLSHMETIKKAILEYAHANNKLPKHLYELSPRFEKNTTTKDAWGREIRYIINSNNTITLISFGQDDKKGGTGINQDIIGIFKFKDKKSQWEHASRNWLKKPVY